ncbi:MAG: N-(5'-phosphoribosyl)anthranilate isomerase [Candidatus Xenobia bacterium]
MALRAGAAAVGFVLAPSRRQVSVELARELASQAGGAVRVAVLVNPSPAQVEECLEFCEFVQLHGDESPEFCQGYAPRVWKAFRLESRAQLEQVGAYSGKVAAFLLDAAQPGAGAPFAWEWLAGWSRPGPIWLAGGLTADNVAQAVNLVRPDGVDVSTGVEASPGRKDAELIRRFMARALSGSSRANLPESSPTHRPGASP